MKVVMNSIGSIVEIWLTRLAMECKDLGSLACNVEGSSVVSFSIMFHESIGPKLLLHFRIFLHILENQLFYCKLVAAPFKFQLIYFCQLMKFLIKGKKVVYQKPDLLLEFLVSFCKLVYLLS